MMITIFSLIGLLAMGLITVWIYSPGSLSQLKDDNGKIIPGGINEKIWIEVNGEKHGMFIRGENPSNPVLLYLHGGPGTPLLPFISYLEKTERLEKYFTVCYWDQRGAGMSYSELTDPTTLTIDQMVEDTHVVTRYIKSRFGQNKIYLIGHSWGSYLGVKTIEKYPEDYRAYFGIGQLSYQLESERIAYTYLLDHSRNIGDTKAVRNLEKHDPYSQGFPQKDYNLQVRTPLINKYGVGMLHQGATLGNIAKALLTFKGYTIYEKIKFVRGANQSIELLFDGLTNDNLFETSPRFEIPFYIFHGKYDYQVSYKLAKGYLNAIEAPRKGFFTFENSAHSPNMEEPEKFITFLREIDNELNISGF